MHVEPTTLRGPRLVLEPYTPQALEEVAAAALSAPEIFRYLPVRIATREDVSEVCRLSAPSPKRVLDVEWIRS